MSAFLKERDDPRQGQKSTWGDEREASDSLYSKTQKVEIKVSISTF